MDLFPYWRSAGSLQRLIQFRIGVDLQRVIGALSISLKWESFFARCTADSQHKTLFGGNMRRLELFAWPMRMILGALVVMLLIYGGATAQTGTAAVRGTVLDQQNNAVAGASITISDATRNFSRTRPRTLMAVITSHCCPRRPIGLRLKPLVLRNR